MVTEKNRQNNDNVQRMPAEEDVYKRQVHRSVGRII